MFMPVKQRITDYARQVPAKISSGGHYIVKQYREASTGVKVAVVVAVAGGVSFLAYELYQAFTSASGPGCSTLQSELTSVIKQQFSIYENAVTYHGGTMTATQQGQIKTLQQQQATLTNEIAKNCTPPAGQTLNKYLNQIIAFAGWTAIALIAIGGVVITARMTKWLISRWGGGSSDPSSPPTSVLDADPPDTFQPTTMNMDYAGGQVINNVQNEVITPEQGANVMPEIADTDAVAVNATTISDFYTTLATADAAISAEFADIMDAYSEAFADAVTLDSEVADDAVAVIATL